MTQIHTLNKNGVPIYPVTHISAVVDDNGNTVAELIKDISTKIPDLTDYAKTSDLEELASETFVTEQINNALGTINEQLSDI